MNTITGTGGKIRTIDTKAENYGGCNRLSNMVDSVKEALITEEIKILEQEWFHERGGTKEIQGVEAPRSQGIGKFPS